MSCSDFRWCPRCHSKNIATGYCYDCHYEWTDDDYYYDYKTRDYVYIGDDDDDDDCYDDDDDDDDDDCSNNYYITKNYYFRNKGSKCFKCNSYNTYYDRKRKVHHCNNCGREW